jgi:hypothetical protein
MLVTLEAFVVLIALVIVAVLLVVGGVGFLVPLLLLGLVIWLLRAASGMPTR